MIGDIVLLRRGCQQYGGFTVPSVDHCSEPYAERSYKTLTEKYTRLGLDADTVEKEVMADILNDFEQGFRAGNTSSTRSLPAAAIIRLSP